MPKNPAPLEGGAARYGLVGDSPAIEHVLRIIEKLRNDVSPVLISGETGVGKELVARALHGNSPLAARKFVAVDSASLVGTLMESEMFGHLRGAFTGAIENKIGLVREADGGTLFLDEIGELPPEVQAKLLRLLQEQEVRPIGAAKAIKVDVRIIAATNRDLKKEVEQGRFRQDLYYRLRVIPIHVPPLRERKQDVPLLIRHFVKKYAVEDVQISEGALRRLLQHDWPGNVRELENSIRSMVALKTGVKIGEEKLPPTLREAASPSGSAGGIRIPTLRELEKRHILRTLNRTNGSIVEAAAMLGVSQTTLYRKIKQYNFSPAHFRFKPSKDGQQQLFGKPRAAGPGRP